MFPQPLWCRALIMISNVSAEETPSLVQLNKTDRADCLQLLQPLGPAALQNLNSPQKNCFNVELFSSSSSDLRSKGRYVLDVLFSCVCVRLCVCVCVCCCCCSLHFFELLIEHDYFHTEWENRCVNKAILVCNWTSKIDLFFFFRKLLHSKTNTSIEWNGDAEKQTIVMHQDRYRIREARVLHCVEPKTGALSERVKY